MKLFYQLSDSVTCILAFNFLGSFQCIALNDLGVYNLLKISLKKRIILLLCIRAKRRNGMAEDEMGKTRIINN